MLYPTKNARRKKDFLRRAGRYREKTSSPSGNGVVRRCGRSAMDAGREVKMPRPDKP
jgi:hypothetical protein